MRIYNGTKSQLDLPLTPSQRIQIPAHSVSGDVLPNNEFLSLLVGSYDYNEIALIISGPYEINMCSNVSGAVGFVVNSLEEAIARFTPKTTTPEPKPEEVKEVEVKEEVIPEPEKNKDGEVEEGTMESEGVLAEDEPTPSEPVVTVNVKKKKTSKKKNEDKESE